MSKQTFQARNLVVRGLRVELLGRVVLDDIHLCAGPGRPTLIFGPNGSGKSTLLHALGGFYQCAGGSIQLDRQDLTRASASARGRAGIAIQFQRLRLFPNLTVREQLLAACVPAYRFPLWTALAARRRLRVAEAEASRAIDSELDQLGLAGCADRSPMELSYGQQMLVAHLRALFRNPRLLLCDEPLAGLAVPMKALMIKRLEAAAASGIITLVVGHDMAAFQELDWDAVFLDRGKVELTGSVTKLLGEDRIAQSYLGRAEGVGLATASPVSDGLESLHIKGLCAGYGSQQVLHDVSLCVRPGQVIGLVGHNGSGKTTLLEAVFGFAARKRGYIHLGADELRPNPFANARQGVTYVPQASPYFDSLTVEENLALCTRSLQAADTSRGRQPSGAFATRLVGSLSNGERQALLIDRLRIGQPRLIMLDEPSVGLSPTKCKEVAHEIRSAWSSAGCPPMLVAEQNIPFLLDLATDIVILQNGQVTVELSPGPGALREIESRLGFALLRRAEGPS